MDIFDGWEVKPMLKLVVPGEEGSNSGAVAVHVLSNRSAIVRRQLARPALFSNFWQGSKPPGHILSVCLALLKFCLLSVRIFLRLTA